MKKKYILVPSVLIMTAIIFSSYDDGPGNHGLNRTGGMGSSGNCSGSGCHATASSSNTEIYSAFFYDLANNTGVLNGKYIPGHTYRIEVSGGNHNSLPYFGFQAGVQTASGANAGSVDTQLNEFNTHAIMVGGIDIMEHTAPKQANSIINGFADYGFTFKWTAPPAGAGTVTLSIVMNGVNHDGTSNGDQPSLTYNTTMAETITNGISNTSTAVSSVCYPNPAKETLHVSLAQPGTYTFTILDAAGRLVSSRQSPVITGDFQLPVANLPAGAYKLLVQGKDKRPETIGFVKQ